MGNLRRKTLCTPIVTGVIMILVFQRRPINGAVGGSFVFGPLVFQWLCATRASDPPVPRGREAFFLFVLFNVLDINTKKRPMV